jgi:hypothetical protein
MEADVRQPVIDELPSLESLPQTICRLCKRSLINGLFNPAELRHEDRMRCMRCVGEISQKSRAKKWNAGQERGWNNRKEA